MPLTRSPEQVVYEGLKAKWNADSDKWGQGTAGVKVFSLYRDRIVAGRSASVAVLRHRHAGFPAADAVVVLTGSWAGHWPNPVEVPARHGRVQIDQIADAIRSRLHKVDLYRSLVDVDYRPGYCTITGVLRTVDIGQHESAYTRSRSRSRSARSPEPTSRNS